MANAAMRRVAKELKRLHQEPLEGITLLPNDQDMRSITAVLEGPVDTPFQGGQFKLRLRLTNDFPSAPPTGAFITKIFHPNVSNKGEICVNTLKRDWTPDKTIKDILLTIKCLLIVPNAESALNEEAGRLLLERYEDYCKHARLMTSVHAAKRFVTPTVAVVGGGDGAGGGAADAGGAGAPPAATKENALDNDVDAAAAAAADGDTAAAKAAAAAGGAAQGAAAAVAAGNGGGVSGGGGGSAGKKAKKAGGGKNQKRSMRRL